MQAGKHDNVTALNPATGISTARWVKSKDKGTRGIEIDFTNEGGETLTGTLWVTDKTMARVVKSLRYMGWQGDDLADLSTVGLVACQITVVEEEYNGRVYSRLGFVNENESTGGGSTQPKMEADEVKAFAAKMRGAVIAAGGKPSAPVKNPARAPQHRQTKAPPSESTDPADGLPF